MPSVTPNTKTGSALSSIIRIGTKGIHDEANIKSIILVNTLSLTLGSLILVIGAVFYILTKNQLILIPATLECLIAFSALYLNHLRKNKLAALTIFFLQCFAVIYFGIVLGEILVLQLMIIFLIAITYLIFNDPTIRKICLAMALCTLVTLELCYYYNVGPYIHLNYVTGYIFKWCSMSGILLLIILTGMHYVRSSDFKRVFIYQITHELRTPLNAILVATQLIKRELKFNPNLQNIDSLSDHLLAAGNSARNIINNVLDMAQIESGKMDKQDETAFLFQPFFQQIVGIHHVIAQYKSIRLKLETELMPEVILGDPLKLHTITTNLLSNAIKYADKNTEIVIHLSGSADLWQIQITNQGVGIPADKQDIIFEPFVTHKNKKEEGTGLGLFITRIKVASMGGNIGVTSKPGEFTTFTVTLPLREGKLTDIKKEVSSDNDNSPFDMHVLIADDNDMNNILLAKYLKQMGCRVTMTVNGLEAIQQAEKETPDVIILDYHMPIMDGKEALILFKHTSTLKHIPVIMATADAYKNSKQILMDAGADAFLEKPISFNRLHSILVECVKK